MAANRGRHPTAEQLLGDLRSGSRLVENRKHGLAIRHYLHSTTADELSKKLSGRIEEWDTYAKSRGVAGVRDVD